MLTRGWCPLCMARFRWAGRAVDRLASGRRPGRRDVVRRCGWPLVQRISAMVQRVVASSSEIVCSSCAIAPWVYVALWGRYLQERRLALAPCLFPLPRLLW